MWDRVDKKSDKDSRVVLDDQRNLDELDTHDEYFPLHLESFDSPEEEDDWNLEFESQYFDEADDAHQSVEDERMSEHAKAGGTIEAIQQLASETFSAMSMYRQLSSIPLLYFALETKKETVKVSLHTTDKIAFLFISSDKDTDYKSTSDLLQIHKSEDAAFVTLSMLELKDLPGITQSENDEFPSFDENILSSHGHLFPGVIAKAQAIRDLVPSGIPIVVASTTCNRESTILASLLAIYLRYQFIKSDYRNDVVFQLLLVTAESLEREGNSATSKPDNQVITFPGRGPLKNLEAVYIVDVAEQSVFLGAQIKHYKEPSKVKSDEKYSKKRSAASQFLMRFPKWGLHYSSHPQD